MPFFISTPACVQKNSDIARFHDYYSFNWSLFCAIPIEIFEEKKTNFHCKSLQQFFYFYQLSFTIFLINGEEWGKSRLRSTEIIYCHTISYFHQFIFLQFLAKESIDFIFLSSFNSWITSIALTLYLHPLFSPKYCVFLAQIYIV